MTAAWIVVVPRAACDPHASTLALCDLVVECSAPLDEHDLPIGFPRPMEDEVAVVAFCAPHIWDARACVPATTEWLDAVGFDALLLAEAS